MRLSVVAVGRLKLDYARSGCAEYAARIQHAFPFAQTVEYRFTRIAGEHITVRADRHVTECVTRSTRRQIEARHDGAIRD